MAADDGGCDTSRLVQASNYDQSCQTDSDCVGVGEGYACECETVFCVTAAINASAYTQWKSDVEVAQYVSTLQCGCPIGVVGATGKTGNACCSGGTCQGCPFPSGLTGDAATDASTDAATEAAVSADAESRAGRVPVNHRPSDAQCSTPAPPGDCAAPYPGGGCASDSDCTEAGTNGRCINPGGGPAAPCFCTNDMCIVDTDCPSGQTCACHGAPYTDARGNTCVKGNCRVDADCGSGGYCSPSSNTGICGDSLAGYYCHTAADLCIDDSDCPQSPIGSSGTITVGNPGCVYSTTDSRWECIIVPVCE